MPIRRLEMWRNPGVAFCVGRWTWDSYAGFYVAPLNPERPTWFIRLGHWCIGRRVKSCCRAAGGGG